MAGLLELRPDGRDVGKTAAPSGVVETELHRHRGGWEQRELLGTIVSGFDGGHGPHCDEGVSQATDVGVVSDVGSARRCTTVDESVEQVTSAAMLGRGGAIANPYIHIRYRYILRA